MRDPRRSRGAPAGRQLFWGELTDEIAPARDAEGKIDIQGTMQAITGVVEAGCASIRNNGSGCIGDGGEAARFTPSQKHGRRRMFPRVTFTSDVRCAVAAPGSPNVLLVYPRFAAATFWNFSATCELMGARYPAAPLGLITLAAMLPAAWNLRLIDRNAEELHEPTSTGPTW